MVTLGVLQISPCLGTSGLKTAPFKFILSSPFLWCPVLPSELRRQQWRQKLKEGERRKQLTKTLPPGTKNKPALRTWKKGKYQLHFLPTGQEEGMASRRFPGAHILHEHVGWKDCSKVLRASPRSRKCLLAHVNSRGKGGFYFSFYDWLISLSIMFSLSIRFMDVVACIRISFPFNNEVYSFVYVHCILFIHSSVNRHLDHFHLLAVMNNVLWTLVYKYLF